MGGAAQRQATRSESSSDLSPAHRSSTPRQQITVLVAGAVLLAGVARADVTVKVEAGTEVDSNVHRITTERGAEEAAAGARLALRVASLFRPAERHLVRISALAAARLFPSSEASNEDVGVLAADARWDVAVGAAAPGLRLSYYDADVASSTGTGAGVDHDFRTGAAAGALTLRSDDDHRLELTAGGRFFQYKPDPDFDFAGVQLGASLGRRLRSEDATWELSWAASYNVAQRAYGGRALANLCPAGQPIAPSCLLVTSADRADLFHDLGFEISYTRAFIAALRYALQINDSNSFGQSLVRHRVEVSGTAELFLDIFVTAKVVLVFNRYLDALLLAGDVGTFITIEDEARNGVILHATRDLSRALTLEARYAFYANPFAQAALEYRRHTFYLGLVYRFGD